MVVGRMEVVSTCGSIFGNIATLHCSGVTVALLLGEFRSLEFVALWFSRPCFGVGSHKIRSFCKSSSLLCHLVAHGFVNRRSSLVAGHLELSFE